MQRVLGKTGVSLSPIGFGCASIWGNRLISDAEAIGLFETAYDLGITYFDTGHSYGLAEERIGKALKTGSVPRDKIVISTKFGTRILNGKPIHDVSPAWIRESVQLSLQRMGIEYVDLLSIHGTRSSDFNDETFETLQALKKEGLVRFVGASTSNSAELIEEISHHDWFDYVFLRYNILNRALEPLIEALNRQGIGVIAGAPLAEALYSERIYHPHNKKDLWYLARAAAHFRRQMREGRRYRFIDHVEGMTGAQIALRYVLDNPCIASAVIGTTSKQHLFDNMQTLQMDIPPDILLRIQNT